MIPRRIPFFAPNSMRKAISFYTHNTKTDEVERLEDDLKKILRLPNPVVVGQGRVGLKIILQSLGIKPKSEIIMPGYTFGTLTNVIKDAGFTPISVDIDEYTLQMSPRAAQEAVTKNTSAILATHLFGEPCDIKSFQKLAKKHNLYLIEDCAQSLGATLGGRLTGTFGDVAFSSFDIAKNLQGVRGGVVFSKNKKLMGKIKLQRDGEKIAIEFPLTEIIRTLFGYILIQTPIWYLLMYIFSYKKMQSKFVEYYRAGVNKKVSYLMPPIYATITRGNLPTLKSRLKKRRKIRDLYYSLLKDKLVFQTKQKYSLGSAYMIAAHTNVDVFKLRRYLSYHGIDIALADEIADNGLGKESMVEKVLKNSIALPINEGITSAEIHRVANRIDRFTSSTR